MSLRQGHDSPVAKVYQLHEVKPSRKTRKKIHLDDDTRRRVTVELLTAADTNRDRIPSALLRQVSDRTGVSARILQYWVRDARNQRLKGLPALPQQRQQKTSKYQNLDRDEICELLLQCGSIQAAWEKAVVAGLIPQGHPNSFRQALYEQLGYDRVQGLLRGLPWLSRHWVYPKRHTDVGLTDLITIDLFFPRVRLSDVPENTWDDIEEEHKKGAVYAGVRAAGTNVILAWKTYKKHPTSRDIRALIGQAFLGWTIGGVFIGGVFSRLMCDREALFLTPELRAELGAFGCDVDPTNSYSSWENGGHERMHGVIRSEALIDVLASNDGVKGRDGKPALAEITMTFGELSSRMDRWSMSYNLERGQEALEGLTPVQAWVERVEAGEQPDVRKVSDLSRLALPLDTRVPKSKSGVWLGPNAGYRGTPGHFIGSALMKIASKNVDVRYWPNENRAEAFDPTTGRWKGSLYRNDENLPAEAEAEIHGRRAKTRRTVESLVAEARRREAVREGTGSPQPTPRGDDGGDDTTPVTQERPSDGEPATPPPDSSTSGDSETATTPAPVSSLEERLARLNQDIKT